MPLLINKDGKQLGPFSVEEARAMVLTGKLSPNDWAWPDNATDWIPLKEVAGYAAPRTSTLTPPPPPAVAAAGATTPASAEEELWRGHPSQVLDFNIYLFWSVVLIIALVLAFTVVDSLAWGLGLFGVVAVVGLVQMAASYIHLRSIEYVVTTQRVRIISGIFSKDIQEIELFRVKDTMARQSFFLRLFKLGTITILSGDPNHPRLVLSGVPRALELRERLRQEIMTLRQRFGVRELDVM
jgi:membrane protein YdbS with pleckstrin-like domain